MNYKRHRPRRPRGRDVFLWVPPRKRERQLVKRDMRKLGREIGTA